MFGIINLFRCDRIWELTDFFKSGIINKDGKPVDTALKIKHIPSIEDLSKGAIMNLERNGYLVKRVSPYSANAVIRVFKKESYPYDGANHWLFGVYAYLKTPGTFPWKFHSKEGIALNCNDFQINVWFCQDDSTNVSPNYADYYVKITKP